MMIKENLSLGMKSTIQFILFPGKSSLVSLIVWNRTVSTIDRVLFLREIEGGREKIDIVWIDEIFIKV